MREIQTNLYISFDSEGAKPSEVVRKLNSVGFIPSQGSVDFVYTWPGKPTFDEIIGLLDNVTELLRDTKVKYSSETIGV